MKYKFIHSTYLMLFLLIVCACSENYAFLPLPDVDEPNTALDTAYVSLAIDLNDYPATKAYEGESPAGTSAEDFVRQVRIVLFDGEGMTSKVVKCFDFDIQTNPSGTGAWIDDSEEGKDLAGTTNLNDKSQFITYARKVPAMDLKMLVIVNATPGLKALTEKGCMYGPLTSGAKIETGTAKSDDVGGLAQNNYFLMTSGPGLITVPRNKLKETIREAHNDPISATVSRVVSKVTLVSSNGGETFPANNNASVTDIQWELDITNRYTYWTIQGQADGNRENWYWTDPNYSGYGSKPVSELQNDFFYFAFAGNPYPTFKKRVKESEYCLENTMDETDQYITNVITRALIRCIYKPANVNIAGEGFYVYNGNTYSIDEMREFAREASQLPGSLLTGFYKAIQEAATEESYSFLTGKPIKNNQEVTQPFTTKGITYYYKGINYYAVKIRHRGNDDSTTPGYAHYGVLRNTHYTITIDRINGPGSPGILWDDIATRSTDRENSTLYNNIESSIIYGADQK